MSMQGGGDEVWGSGEAEWADAGGADLGHGEEGVGALGELPGGVEGVSGEAGGASGVGGDNQHRLLGCCVGYPAMVLLCRRWLGLKTAFTQRCTPARPHLRPVA